MYPLITYLPAFVLTCNQPVIFIKYLLKSLDKNKNI